MIQEFNPIRVAQMEFGDVSRQTIYNLIAQGRLHRVNLGRRAFITGASIEALKAEIMAGRTPHLSMSNTSISGSTAPDDESSTTGLAL
jgi:hypothetical protein